MMRPLYTYYLQNASEYAISNESLTRAVLTLAKCKYSCYNVGMRKIKPRSNCRVSFALDVLGDKWTLLIIRDLMLRGKSYYGDFLNSEEKIATNILADRLQVLEHQGIITKSRDEQVRTKYRYRLTRKGLDLLPILVEMMLWGSKYAPKTHGLKNPVMKELILRARKDKDGLTQEITRDVEENQLGLS